MIEKEYLKKLNLISPLITVLNIYHEISTSLKIGKLVSTDELFEHHKDWVQLISKFEGIEKEYFKPYWLPLSTGRMDLFVDLSSDAFTIFESMYFIYEPYFYFSIVLFDSIHELIEKAERHEDFDEHMKLHETKKWQLFREKVVERHKLIFEGKIVLEKPNYIEVFDVENINKPIVSFDGKYYTITCEEVNALICGLLPYELDITVIYSTFDLTKYAFLSDYNIKELKTIRDFTHAIRLYLSHNMHYFSCIIDNNQNEWFDFRDEKFVLYTSNEALKDYFIESYNELLLSE